MQGGGPGLGDNKKKDESIFEEVTRKPKPPNIESVKDVPFEQWDWEKHDPEFFRMFSKVGDAQDPAKLN